MVTLLSSDAGLGPDPGESTPKGSSRESGRLYRRRIEHNENAVRVWAHAVPLSDILVIMERPAPDSQTVGYAADRGTNRGTEPHTNGGRR